MSSEILKDQEKGQPSAQAIPTSVSWFKLRQYDPFRTPYYDAIKSIFTQITARVTGAKDIIGSFGPYYLGPGCHSSGALSGLSDDQKTFLQVLKGYQSLLLTGAKSCKPEHIREYLQKATDLANLCNTESEYDFKNNDFYQFCLSESSRVDPKEPDHSRSTKGSMAGLAMGVGSFVSIKFGFQEKDLQPAVALLIFIAFVTIVAVLVYRMKERADITKPDAYAKEELAHLFGVSSGEQRKTFAKFIDAYGNIKKLEAWDTDHNQIIPTFPKIKIPEVGSATVVKAPVNAQLQA